MPDGFIVIAICIAFIITLLGAIIFGICYAFNNKIDQLVLNNSEKIAILQKLNAKTKFHSIKSNFIEKKHYDNKSNFNKIAPEYVMSHAIKNNIGYYTDFCQKVKENRQEYIEYIANVRKIKFDITREKCEELGISFENFLKRESKLFEKTILKPTCDCFFTIIMTYSSPKGKVNLSKRGQFNFDNMVACLESISRSHLDKETYKNLAAVERGEVSDSLRYDVLNRDGFRCVICGASAKEGAHLHVDHIIPIAKGGKSTPQNLRTLCERCNIGKSDKMEGAVRVRSESAYKLDICPYDNPRGYRHTPPYGIH